jgi:hypothetical protein
MRVTFLILAALAVVGCGGKSSGGNEDGGGLEMRPPDGIEYLGSCYCSSALMAVCDTYVCPEDATSRQECYLVPGGYRTSCGDTSMQVCDILVLDNVILPGCCPVDGEGAPDGGAAGCILFPNMPLWPFPF